MGIQPTSGAKRPSLLGWELVYTGGDQWDTVDKRSHKWERRWRWQWCPNRRSSRPVRAQLWPHVAAGDRHPPFYTEIRPLSFRTISAPSLVLPKPPERLSLSEAEVLQLEEVSRKCQATYFCCGVPKMNVWFATSLLWLPASELGSLPSAWVCEVDALWPWGEGKTGTGEAWGLRTLKPGQGHLRLVDLNSLINTVSKPHTWQTGCPGNTAQEQTKQACVFSLYSWFSLF